MDAERLVAIPLLVASVAAIAYARSRGGRSALIAGVGLLWLLVAVAILAGAPIRR